MPFGLDSCPFVECPSYPFVQYPKRFHVTALCLIDCPISEQVQKRNRQFRVLLQQIRDLKEDIQHDDDNDANGKADDDDEEPVGVMDVVEDEE